MNMENNNGRTNRRIKEPKELLLFFKKDYSAVKVSVNKILGTLQQRAELKENSWVDADIGQSEPWKGLVIKTGKSRNELAQCEHAFLDFLNRHSEDKENLPLNTFFEEFQQQQNESDGEEMFSVDKSCEKRKAETIRKPKPKKRLLQVSSVEKPAILQNKIERKLKREGVRVQAETSKKQSQDIFAKVQSLKALIQESEDSEDSETDFMQEKYDGEICPVTDDILSSAPGMTLDSQTKSCGNINKIQEMLATAMKGIHERFDAIEKGVATIVERQEATEKLVLELSAKVSGKSKVSRPLNFVLSHSPLSQSPTPEKQKPVTWEPKSASPIAVEPPTECKEDEGYVGKRVYGITASPSSIKVAEEQARGIPKCMAFNLLNLLVDLKIQAASNISGQNGKQALDKNILNAIKSHLATYFGWGVDDLEINWKKEPMNIRQRIADKCRNMNKKKK